MSHITLGEIIKDNPFYDEGVVFDSKFYQKALSKDALSRPISLKSVQEARVCQSVIEIAKKALLISLVAFPAIAMIGTSAFIPVLLSAGMTVIASADAGDEKLHIVRVVDLKSKLFAALSGQDKWRYVKHELGWDALFKTAFLGSLLAAKKWGLVKVASGLGYVGLFFACYSFMKEVEKVVFIGIEKYAHYQAQKKFNQFQHA